MLILELVRQVLQSPVCASRFVVPLVSRSSQPPGGISPKLSKLVECLSSREGDGGPFRGVVFVKTRTSARRVKNFVNSHPGLCFLRAAVFCGHAEMSSSAQEKVRPLARRNAWHSLVSPLILPAHAPASI